MLHPRNAHRRRTRLQALATGLLLATLATSTAALAEDALRSEYTELEGVGCTVSSPEEAGSTTRCAGPAGFAVLVYDDDNRMSLAVVTPDGKTHELDLWYVISRAFSELGPRVEWRLRGDQPVALIVRMNAFEQENAPDQKTSYMAVATIESERICVTDRLEPRRDQNVVARQLADSAAGRACLEAGE